MKRCPGCGASVSQEGKFCAECGATLQQEDSTLRGPRDTADSTLASEGRKAVAEVFGDRFEVVAKLGAGAFGEVYRARDRMLGRDVAIKRIRLAAMADDAQLGEVKERFVREARIAAQLRHPNIVTTHDIVTSDEGSFIVLELVEGETLDARLRERGRLGLQETVDVLAQAAAALDHAHRHGVVHRDVKPSNIMIEPSGSVKVMDFGVAKSETAGNLTATGMVIGTPNYMSPEQARGAKVDGRSDLFSLGCIAYECVTGQKPFRGENVTGILMRILTEAPEPMDPVSLGLPVGANAVLDRALAKGPDQRFQAGEDLVDALRSLGSGRPLNRTEGARAVTPPPPPPQPLSPVATGQRKRTWGLAGAAAILVVLAVVALARMGSHPTPESNVTREAADPDRPRLIEETQLSFWDRVLGKKPLVVITVPEATPLSLSLETPLSSESAKTGDRFTTVLASPVIIEGVEALPEGSKVVGHVSQVEPAGKVRGRAEMTLAFDRLTSASGEEIAIEAEPFFRRARSTAGKDAKIVGGLSAVGALVGGLLGGKKGAVAGGAAGAGAGAGAVVATKGEEVVLPEGTEIPIKLRAAIKVIRARDK
jgi:serine/threonine-protein kinase